MWKIILLQLFRKFGFLFESSLGNDFENKLERKTFYYGIFGPIRVSKGAFNDV